MLIYQRVISIHILIWWFIPTISINNGNRFVVIIPRISPRHTTSHWIYHGFDKLRSVFSVSYGNRCARYFKPWSMVTTITFRPSLSRGRLGRCLLRDRGGGIGSEHGVCPPKKQFNREHMDLEVVYLQTNPFNPWGIFKHSYGIWPIEINDNHDDLPIGNGFPVRYVEQPEVNG